MLNITYNYLGDTKNVYGDSQAKESLENQIKNKISVLEDQSKIKIGSIVITFRHNKNHKTNKFEVQAVVEGSNIDYKTEENGEQPGTLIEILCDNIIRFVRKEKDKQGKIEKTV
jgi:ribosome-associated translation inhibitor RaiA